MDRAQTRRGRLLPAILLLVAVQSILAVKLGVVEGHLVDSDSYTWMNRVSLLHESGNWFDSTNPRIDPPHGHDNHWSRPYDVLLLAGAWIGAPVVGFEEALHGSGVAVNLVLHVLALVAIVWAFSPLLRDVESDVLGLLFIAQMGILVSYYVGRPDHQSLLNVLFIVSIGLMVRLSRDQYRWVLGCTAGLVSAIGIWVGIEFVLAVMVTQVCLGVFWAFGGARFAEKSFHYSAALLVFGAIALFLEEGPEDFLVPMLDQISVPFLALFALITAFWGAMYRLEHSGLHPKPWFPRLVTAGLAGGAAILFMNVLFPGFFSGPDPLVDKLYWTTRIAEISEGKPLLGTAGRSSDNWGGGLIRAVFWLGIAIPALPLLAYRLVKKRGAERRFWIFVAVALLIYLPLVFRQIRWIPYPVTLLLPLYAIFVAGLLDMIWRRAPSSLVAPLRVIVLVTCSVGFLSPVLLQNEAGPASAKAGCPLTSITPYLNDPDELGSRSRNLLAFTDFGPELLYRTPHSVYSYPNHRWQPGYTDSYRIFTAAEDETARELVRRRNVDLILICPEGAESRIFSREDQQETFHQRLSRGAAPAWLVDISPSSPSSGSFRLYQVR